MPTRDTVSHKLARSGLICRLRSYSRSYLTLCYVALGRISFFYPTWIPVDNHVAAPSPVLRSIRCFLRSVGLGRSRSSVILPAPPRSKECLDIPFRPPTLDVASPSKPLRVTEIARYTLKEQEIRINQTGISRMSLNSPPAMTFVLVTGVSGFVGSHVAHRLLEDGYRVKGTVRSAKHESVSRAYAGFGDRFQVTIVEDLVTSDLTEAFHDVHAVIHVGTPLSGRPETVLNGALHGTKNILQHASKARVKKLVVTSSVVCMAKYEDFWKEGLITEHDWNPETFDDAFRADGGFFTTYSVAKKLAELEVRKFAEENAGVAVTTIHPPFIYGPYGLGQSTDLNGFWRLSSNGFVYALISGPPGRSIPPQYPVYPAFIHVKDLAHVHVLAMQSSSPGHVRRVIASGGSFTWKEAVEHIARVRPQLKGRLPRLDDAATSPFARLAVNADGMLGVCEYKGWQETIEETIDDLLRVEAELGMAP